MAEVSLYVSQNVGVEVLDPAEAPSLYPAQNVGLEAKSAGRPSLYIEQNAGDWWTSKQSDQLGPEFAFAPFIDKLTPTFGRVGSTIKLDGVGLGDECTFLRFGQDDAFDASGNYASGTGYARGSVNQTSGTWTLELWFRSQQSGKYGTAARESDGSLVELCDYNAGSPTLRYAVELLGGRVNARVGAASVALTADYYDDGRMHHVRMVYAAGSLNLLVDGVFIGSAAATDHAVDWFRLAGTSTYVRADIREVRFCQANLGTSPYDPNDEWNCTPHGSDVGLWHCDDGSGMTITDSSGEGNNLDLQGDDWLWTDWDFALEVYLGALLCGGLTDVRNLETAFTIPTGSATGQVKVKHTQVHVDESNTKTFVVLPEVPLRGTGYEVRIYDRDNYGTLLAVLENAFAVGGQHELNQACSGQFNLHASDPKATSTVIRHGNLCRIYWDGLERYAFIIEQIAEVLIAEGDETAQTYSCSGRGVMSLLDHALVYPPNWPTREPLKTVYSAKTAGYIIKDQVDRAIARGALTNFSYDFDATNDSNGAVWPETFDLELEPGVTLWSVIQQFVTLGYDIYLDGNLKLHVYITRGLDRTAGDAPVVFRQGHNLFAKQRDSSSAEVKTHALVAAADTLSEFAKSSEFPRRETFMDARTADSVGTAQKAAAMTLETLCVEDEGFSAEIVSIQGCSEVFEDFDVGDWVLVDVPGKEDLESYRVRGITMSIDADDMAHWVVDFNSIRHEWDVRLKRMLDAMTGGSVRGGTGSGRTEGISPTTMVDTAGGKGTFECVVKITVDDAAAFKVQDMASNIVFLVDTVAQEVKIPTVLLVDVIDEYALDTGVTIEAVLIKDGAVDGVDISAHAVDAEAHQALVTLGASADALLKLTGQELDFDKQAANLFLAGPTAGEATEPSFRAIEDSDIPDTIARDSELHAAVTLAADAEVLLGLTGQQLTLDSQTENTVFAGPAAAPAAAPTFRALVDADIPAGIMRDVEHTAIGDNAPHHARYTDAEAIAAVEGEATLNLGGDVTIATAKTLKVDTIDEKTTDAGVTVEGVKSLDGFIELSPVEDPGDAGNGVRLYCKTIAFQPYLYMRRNSFAVQRLVSYEEVIDMVENEAALDLLGDVSIAENRSLSVATVVEKVADAGVTIEGMLVKDGYINTTHRFRAYRNGNWAPSAGVRKVELNAESYDPGGNFDSVTNYRYVAPVTGYYFVTARIGFEIPAGNAEHLVLLCVNSTVVSRGTRIRIETLRTQSFGGVVSDILYLTAGDFVELYEWSNLAPLINGENSTTTYMSGHLLSV